MTSATTAPPTVFEMSLKLYPEFNKFALDFTSGAASASRFLCQLDLKNLKPRREPRDAALARALIRSNREWGNEVGAAVDAWESGQALTLIAGQQVGFAGGPLYTLAKLVSLIALREKLAARGIPATVFFWLATEDHDFDEVSRLALHARDGVREFRADEPAGEHRVVGPLPVPESLRQQLVEFFDAPEPYWLHPGLSFRDSFARLVVSAMGSGSVVLVDSLLPELRRPGVELFTSILNRWDELQELVSSRSHEFESAGYVPQVQPAADSRYSFLFAITSDGKREPIRQPGEDLVRAARQRPETISTSALTRPLLQDVVLAPDVFIGGPAEVAYYAQVTALHDALQIRQPQVALRGHAFAAPMKVLRAIEKYNLEVDELFLPVDELITRHETHSIRKLDAIISRIDSAVEDHLGALRQFIAEHDSTSARAADHSLRKIRYQLKRAGERGRRAVARRDADRHSALTRLHQTLVPNGQPQDRVIGWVGYWWQYGKHLIERMTAEIEPGTDRLKIIGL